MTQAPSLNALATALEAAGAAHHDYEDTVLRGIRDEGWSGFYAAFVLGRLGDFMAPGRLATLLGEVDAAEGWADAAHVLRGSGEDPSG